MDVGAVAVDGGSVLPGRGWVGDGRVWEAGGFGDHVDDVHSEAADAFVEPEAHVVVDCLAELRVVPVEVGLFFGEDAKVEFVGLRVVFPCAAFEERLPVVGRQAEFDAVYDFCAALLPDVPEVLVSLRLLSLQDAESTHQSRLGFVLLLLDS